MSDLQKKLRHDLEVIETMAEKMDAYLDSDSLFWNMGPGIPALTLGGFLMRQYRLDALKDKLTAAEQERFLAAAQQVNGILAERVVAFEKKAHHEIESRLRQWQEYLRDRDWESSPRQMKAHQQRYATAVEARAMLAALTETLQTPPYQLDKQVPQRLESLDQRQRGQWQDGEFVWTEGLEPAYPQDEFWWLYGRFSTTND
ncbi:MAG: hypothetical protein R6X32_07320 [Chloroflexota bacterium]